MQFEIVEASGGYRAQISGDNHELVWWTEVYTTREAAQHAIDLVKESSPGTPAAKPTVMAKVRAFLRG